MVLFLVMHHSWLLFFSHAPGKTFFKHIRKERSKLHSMYDSRWWIQFSRKQVAQRESGRSLWVKAVIEKTELDF